MEIPLRREISRWVSRYIGYLQILYEYYLIGITIVIINVIPTQNTQFSFQTNTDLTNLSPPDQDLSCVVTTIGFKEN